MSDETSKTNTPVESATMSSKTPDVKPDAATAFTPPAIPSSATSTSPQTSCRITKKSSDSSSPSSSGASASTTSTASTTPSSTTPGAASSTAARAPAPSHNAAKEAARYLRDTLRNATANSNFKNNTPSSTFFSPGEMVLIRTNLDVLFSYLVRTAGIRDGLKRREQQLISDIAEFTRTKDEFILQFDPQMRGFAFLSNFWINAVSEINRTKGELQESQRQVVLFKKREKRKRDELECEKFDRREDKRRLNWVVYQQGLEIKRMQTENKKKLKEVRSRLNLRIFDQGLEIEKLKEEKKAMRKQVRNMRCERKEVLVASGETWLEEEEEEEEGEGESDPVALVPVPSRNPHNVAAVFE